MMTSFLFAVALSFLTDDADFPQTSASSANYINLFMKSMSIDYKFYPLYNNQE